MLFRFLWLTLSRFQTLVMEYRAFSRPQSLLNSIFDCRDSNQLSQELQSAAPGLQDAFQVQGLARPPPVNECHRCGRNISCCYYFFHLRCNGAADI
jgi:hypothetical protein